MSRFLRLSDGRIRAKRIASESSLLVESRTIGTEMSYNLETENLSRTGFLLNSASYCKVPFQLNTILELRIDTKGRVLREPVQCLGKIVRVETAPEADIDGVRKRRYGIAIVQIEGSHVEAWDKAVMAMERDPQGSNESQTFDVAA